MVEVITLDKNGEYEIKATPEALALFKEKLTTVDTFSYKNGDHLKGAIENEKLMRAKNDTKRS